MNTNLTEKEIEFLRLAILSDLPLRDIFHRTKFKVNGSMKATLWDVCLSRNAAMLEHVKRDFGDENHLPDVGWFREYSDLFFERKEPRE